MPDEQDQRIPGLYEGYAAMASSDLMQQQIFHSELIAWDDDDAVQRFREKAGGMYRDVNVRRIMDVRV